MITLGGNAELELVDSMDPFSEGIIFSVMPPKKSWKNISNLSGGEKVRIVLQFLRFRTYQTADAKLPGFGIRSTRLQGMCYMIPFVSHADPTLPAHAAILHGRD